MQMYIQMHPLTGLCFVHTVKYVSNNASMYLKRRAPIRFPLRVYHEPSVDAEMNPAAFGTWNWFPQYEQQRQFSDGWHWMLYWSDAPSTGHAFRLPCKDVKSHGAWASHVCRMMPWSFPLTSAVIPCNLWTSVLSTARVATARRVHAWRSKALVHAHSVQFEPSSWITYWKSRILVGLNVSCWNVPCNVAFHGCTWCARLVCETWRSTIVQCIVGDGFLNTMEDFCLAAGTVSASRRMCSARTSANVLTARTLRWVTSTVVVAQTFITLAKGVIHDSLSVPGL